LLAEIVFVGLAVPEKINFAALTCRMLLGILYYYSTMKIKAQQ
jgi:hypothetical protein